MKVVVNSTTGGRSSSVKHRRDPSADDPRPLCHITNRDADGEGSWLLKDEAALPHHRWCKSCEKAIEQDPPGMTRGVTGELERPLEIVENARHGRLDEVRAVKATSGKWHLTGGEGCFNNGAATATASRAVGLLESGKERDWCYYCELRLTILQQQAEIERLEAEVGGASADD